MAVKSICVTHVHIKVPAVEVAIVGDSDVVLGGK